MQPDYTVLHGLRGCVTMCAKRRAVRYVIRVVRPGDQLFADLTRPLVPDLWAQTVSAAGGAVHQPTTAGRRMTENGRTPAPARAQAGDGDAALRDLRPGV